MDNSGKEYAFLNFMEERLKKVVQNKKQGFKKLKVNENDTLETIARKFEKYATGPNKDYNNIYFELDGIYISSAECKTAESVIEKFKVLQNIRTQNYNQYYVYNNKRVLSNLLFNGKSAEHKLEIVKNIKDNYKTQNDKDTINEENNELSNNEIDTIDIPIFITEKKDKQSEQEKFQMDNIDIPIVFENKNQQKKQKTSQKPIKTITNQELNKYEMDNIDISLEQINNNKSNLTKTNKEIINYNNKNYYKESFDSLEEENQHYIAPTNAYHDTGDLFDALIGYVDERHKKLMSKKEKLEFIVNSDLKTLENKRDMLVKKISEYDMSIEIYNDQSNIKNILGIENRNNIKNIIENNSIKEVKEKERDLKEELEELEFAIEKKKADKMQYYHKKYGKVVDEISKLKKLKINKIDYLKYNTKIKIKNIMTHNLDLKSIKEKCKIKLLKNKNQEEIKESYTNGK